MIWKDRGSLFSERAWWPSCVSMGLNAGPAGASIFLVWGVPERPWHGPWGGVLINAHGEMGRGCTAALATGHAHLSPLGCGRSQERQSDRRHRRNIASRLPVIGIWRRSVKISLLLAAASSSFRARSSSRARRASSFRAARAACPAASTPAPP